MDWLYPSYRSITLSIWQHQKGALKSHGPFSQPHFFFNLNDHPMVGKQIHMDLFTNHNLDGGFSPSEKY